MGLSIGLSANVWVGQEAGRCDVDGTWFPVLRGRIGSPVGFAGVSGLDVGEGELLLLGGEPGRLGLWLLLMRSVGGHAAVAAFFSVARLRRMRSRMLAL